MPDNFIHQLAERLKEALPGAYAQNKMSPNIRFTGHMTPNTHPTRESSVLILFYLKNNELYIPFIQRPKYNGPHSGQISLPGGKFEPQDKDLLDTALRETWEEIGVGPENLQIIGRLTPTYIPNSNFNVTPYIAYLPQQPIFTPDSYEVDDIIEARVTQLIAPETIDLLIKTVQGIQIRAPYFNIDNHQIWGATAMIISELKELICKLDTIPSSSCNVHNDPESQ
ncbi:NUDIX hydrolase [Saccharicrinis fermentans]|uniref:Putative NUDIX hydrolase n=1 Tax=Saccharicrinis fermentans DSM 9555 = JCM 21142 TaxID=869213 RepID=W7YF55_9BACT|nr:CoA pyrophosphatase [Saccharicrinis fermentans]GAF03066.1 putative NUDIX hydrolase [Saccharicrinis fermentans DSM 9555 = JCM 21142]